MSEIKLDYDYVKGKYPQQVLEIEKKIRKGTSKNKNAPLGFFNWFIYYGVEGKAYSIYELLTSHHRTKSVQQLSLEEEADEYMSRVCAWLFASKGRGPGWHSDSSIDNCQEIRDEFIARKK